VDKIPMSYYDLIKLARITRSTWCERRIYIGNKV